MTKGNGWKIVIKCRPLLSRCNNLPNIWRNVTEVYPDAKVEEKHNDIEVTLPSLREDVEVAAFGTPGEDDQIRMQMAIFGRRPPLESDWRIRIYLLHDTVTAVKVIQCTKTYHTDSIMLRFLVVNNCCQNVLTKHHWLRENFNGQNLDLSTIEIEGIYVCNAIFQLNSIKDYLYCFSP